MISYLDYSLFPWSYVEKEVERRFPWRKEIVIVKAKIDKVNPNSSLIFTLNGEQYKCFMRMDGTFTGTDVNDNEYMFTFEPDDVVKIIENDYESVHKAWEEKREAYAEQLREEQRKRDKERLEAEQRKRDAAEAERCKHFWYRLFHKRKSDG